LALILIQHTTTYFIGELIRHTNLQFPYLVLMHLTRDDFHDSENAKCFGFCAS